MGLPERFKCCFVLSPSPVQPLNSAKQREGPCIPQRRGSGVAACDVSFEAASEAQKWWEKCPSRCEGKNSPAGVTQAWLYGDMEY